MSDTATFTGSTLSVQRASASTPISIRVRYTTDPKAVNPASATDALYVPNYTITGPGPCTVYTVVPVGGDSQAFDLIITEPIGVGNWTVTVSSTITTSGAVAIVAPLSASFTVDQTQLVQSLSGGAESDDPESIIRKHLSETLQGVNWNAFIAGLAVPDKYNFQNGRLIFDQIFLATASGKYLERLASAVGVKKPFNVGISDEDYRTLAIKNYSSKLVHEAILDVAEIFYGIDSVRAYLMTDLAEPFELEDGMTLFIRIKDSDYEISFTDSDFNVIGQATAIEVATAITRNLRKLGSKAFALEVKDNSTATYKVKLYADARGLPSSVTVTGGTSQSKLEFPTLISGIYTGTL